MLHAVTMRPATTGPIIHESVSTVTTSEFALTSSSSGTRFGIAAFAAGRKKPVAIPDTAASATRLPTPSTNGRAAKTPKRTRSEAIMSLRRESRSTSGPSRNPITTIGRKSAMRSAATQTPELVSSQTWSVSAMAARYVPKLDPADARKRYPKDGDRRRRPRRLEFSTTGVDATTRFRFRLRPFGPCPSRTCAGCSAPRHGRLLVLRRLGYGSYARFWRSQRSASASSTPFRCA